MTPEEQAKLKEHLRQVAEILYKETPSDKLARFETIELSIREHIQETVAPEIGNFFSIQQEEIVQEQRERFKPASEK